MKKTLTIAGILCLAAVLFNITTLLLDILYYQTTTMNIVWDAISIAITLGTGIAYLVLSGKPNSYLMAHSMIFYLITVLNIFNGFIVWIISFWVQLSLSRAGRMDFIKKSYYKEEPSTSAGQTKEEENADEVIVSEEEYEAEQKATQHLTERLKELNYLKQNKLITEDEYKRLREEAINKCFD